MFLKQYHWQVGGMGLLFAPSLGLCGLPDVCDFEHVGVLEWLQLQLLLEPLMEYHLLAAWGTGPIQGRDHASADQNRTKAAMLQMYQLGANFRSSSGGHLHPLILPQLVIL
jgi:hypothetical protein